MANMKSIFMDMVRNTDMVVFNRCKKGDPLPTYRRGIKVANQRAEVIFEDEQGELDDIFEEMCIRDSGSTGCCICNKRRDFSDYEPRRWRKRQEISG